MTKYIFTVFLFVITTTLLLLAHPMRANSGGDPIVQITRVEVKGQSSTAELKVIYGSVDLQDLMVTDLDGDVTELSQASKIVNVGDVIMLAWEKAIDPKSGSITVPGHVLASTDDQLVIYLEEEIHDAVAWTNGDGSIAAAEAKDLQVLVDDSQWSSNDQAGAVLLPESKIIVREASLDTNSNKDWQAGEGQPGSDEQDDSGDGGSTLPSAGMADIVLLTATGAVFLSSGLRRIFPG